MGKRKAVIIVIIEIVMWCFLFGVRHFSGISVVCGGKTIDDTYISRMYTYRLSRDVKAIRVASIIILLDIILFKINHFGINPRRGGSPPMDRMIVDKTIIMYGDLVHMVPMSLMVVEVVRLISMNIGVVVKI